MVLITGSPAERRAYVDWGVFHVEQGFFDAWQRYKKALSQRNAAIKTGQGASFCRLWDKELETSARYIDKLRGNYFAGLQPYMAALTSQFFPNQLVSFEYRRGWKNDESLIAILDRTFERDKARGYTHAGPHRADIHIQIDGNSAQTGISRGQQKVLVALLKLAQVEQFSRSAAKHCVLLYDDLAAELDENHRKQILAVLRRLPIQLFLTAIEPRQINIKDWPESMMFHVEHGRLK